MQAFEYAAPSSLKNALGMLAPGWGEVDVLAGGTDLLSLMKEYVEKPKRVVNIKNIQELGGIGKGPGGLRIGALVTFEELIASAAVRSEYPSLVMAARGVSSPQIRNLGTVGGDLCQRPRCWYFRMGYGLLAKDQEGRSLAPTGENRYHAIFGGGPAYFVSASSLGPALVALGAKVRLSSVSASREVPAEKFFLVPQSDQDREIALLPNEILTDVIVPPARSARNTTYEVRQKEALDWPLAAASVAVWMKGKTVASARIVMGHVAPIPWRANRAEQDLVGHALTAQTAEAAARLAVADARPLSENAYKVQLAKVAVQRALLAAAETKG